jgi:hypothetical protein
MRLQLSLRSKQMQIWIKVKIISLKYRKEDLLRSFNRTSVALFASTNLRKNVLKSFLKNDIAMGSVKIVLNDVFLENTEHALLK